MNNDKFYTVKEVSAIFSKHQRTVWRWIADGKLDAIKIGRSVRIPTSEVERLKKGGF